MGGWPRPRGAPDYRRWVLNSGQWAGHSGLHGGLRETEGEAAELLAYRA